MGYKTVIYRQVIGRKVDRIWKDQERKMHDYFRICEKPIFTRNGALAKT